MSVGEAATEPLADVEETVEEAEAVAEAEAEEVVAPPADSPPPTSLPPPPPPPPPLPLPLPPSPSPSPPPPAETAVSMDETLPRSSALASLAPSASATLGAVVPGVVPSVVPGGAITCSLAAADLTIPTAPSADLTVATAPSAADAPTAAAAVHERPLSLLVFTFTGLECSVYPLDSSNLRVSSCDGACGSAEELEAPETAPVEPIDFLNRSAHEPGAIGAVLGTTAPPGPPAPS